jgi:hypothetical protein
LTGNYIGLFLTVQLPGFLILFASLPEQQFMDNPPYSDDEEEEDAYDLRHVSSDVEMYPDEIDSDDDDGPLYPQEISDDDDRSASLVEPKISYITSPQLQGGARR